MTKLIFCCNNLLKLYNENSKIFSTFNFCPFCKSIINKCVKTSREEKTEIKPATYFYLPNISKDNKIGKI